MGVSFACGMGVVLTALGLFTLRFGSPSTSLAYLRGERVIASPSTYDVGEGRSGEMKRAVFRLHNLTGSPLTITGGATSCTCITQERFPIRIEPAMSVDMTVSIKLSEKPGMLPQSIILYTDSSEQPEVALRIAGRISPARAL